MQDSQESAVQRAAHSWAIDVLGGGRVGGGGVRGGGGGGVVAETGLQSGGREVVIIAVLRQGRGAYVSRPWREREEISRQVKSFTCTSWIWHHLYTTYDLYQFWWSNIIIYIWNMYCDICTDVCISCRRLLDKRHAMQCLVSVTPSLTPGPQSRLCVHTIGSRYQPIWRSKAWPNYSVFDTKAYTCPPDQYGNSQQ